MRISLLLLILLLIPSVAAQGYLGNTILEGETKEFMVNDRVYEITLVTVSDSKGIAIFKVNGEMSKSLGEREKHRFSDNSELMIANIYPNEASEIGGGDMVEFYFMATGGSLSKPQVTRQAQPAGDYGDIVDMFNSLIAGEPVTKKRSVECILDTDCKDADGCTADGCAGGQCVHLPQKGCSYDASVCVATNTRMNVNDIPRFCGTDGRWKPQVTLGKGCTENHQCVSNLCYEGVCKRVSGNGQLTTKTEEEEAVPKPPIEIVKQTVPEEPIPAPVTEPVLEQPTPVPTPAPAATPFRRFMQWIFNAVLF